MAEAPVSLPPRAPLAAADDEEDVVMCAATAATGYLDELNDNLAAEDNVSLEVNEEQPKNVERLDSESREGVSKRNSLEIRNSIPVPGMESPVSPVLSAPEANTALASNQGAVPKMLAKCSPGLARRQNEGPVRDSSSSEKDEAPPIDTTVISAQKEFEQNLRNGSAPFNSGRNHMSSLERKEKQIRDFLDSQSHLFNATTQQAQLMQPPPPTAPASNPDEASAMPPPPPPVNPDASKDVKNEYDYVKYARVQSGSGDSYVGMRLAFSNSSDSLSLRRSWSGLRGSSDEEHYLGSSHEGSPEKQLQQPVQRMSKVNEDTLTEIPLNGGGSDNLLEPPPRPHNFSLSPEPTECDSAEVESVLSEEGEEEEGKSSASGMPVVEDGLSSSQGSDVDEPPPPAADRKGPADILKHRHKQDVEQQLSAAAAATEAWTRQQQQQQQQKPESDEPVWVMRESYVRKLQRQEEMRRVREEIERRQEVELSNAAEPPFEPDTTDDSLRKPPPSYNRSNGKAFQSTKDFDTDEETDELLEKQYSRNPDKVEVPAPESQPQQHAQVEQRRSRVREGENESPPPGPPSNSTPPSEPQESLSMRDPDNDTVLIEGVLFRARYLGSTTLISEGQPSKAMRMMQAQEAVGRIKAPVGENQPSTDVDLFVSAEKIMVLNTDLQEIMMDHALRTISYIADIGDILVIMARRGPVTTTDPTSGQTTRKRQAKVICHVFETDEAQLIAQSIGQAFQVAYMEFLKANGIDDPGLMKEMDYQEVLNQQEIYGEELYLFANKDMQKEVVVPKLKGEPLGIVIVESGWGSMVPTVVLANMAPTGAANRCGCLNIGDQIMSINGVSLVGLPLSTCQTYIKNAAKNQTVIKLNVVSCPPVVEVCIKRPDIKYQLGFSVQNGVICSLLRGGIAERGGVRVGHRIIEINSQSVVAVPHEKIVNMLASAVGEIHMKTMPTSIFRLITGQDTPHFI